MTSKLISSLIILLYSVTISLSDQMVYYELKDGTPISEILNDLGTCPLWGKGGHVKKVLDLNPDINPDDIVPGSKLKIPYSFLKNPAAIHFYAGGKVVPKSSGNNLCGGKRKKQSNKKSEDTEEKSELPAVNASPKAVVAVEIKPEAKKKKMIRATFLQSIRIQGDENTVRNGFFLLRARFSKPVRTKSVPKLKVQAKGNLGFAVYQSGDGSDELTFLYRFDYDLSKIERFKIFIPSDQSDFDVKDEEGRPVLIRENFFELPSEFTDHSPPRISQIRAISNGTYKNGDLITFEVEFSEDIVINGHPKLFLIFDNGRKEAVYTNSFGSKRARFSYSVAIEDAAEKGVEVSGIIDVSGGEITDWKKNPLENNYPNQFFREVKIVQAVPRVINTILPQPRVYNFNEVLNFSLIYDRNIKVRGSPRLKLKIGNNFVYAAYVSHTDRVINFEYKVGVAQQDGDGITLIPEVDMLQAEIAGEDGVPASTSFKVFEKTGINIDAGEPSINSVSTPDKDKFVEGEEIKFTVHFNENIFVNRDPYVNILLGEKMRVADYVSGSGTKSLNFKYVVKMQDDSKGLTIESPMRASEGALVDVSGNFPNLKFNTTVVRGVEVDTNPPKIIRIETVYEELFEYGDNIQFLVYFDEPVQVEGKPRLKLELKTGDVFAEYRSGNGSDRLIFNYIVHPTDKDLDGIEIQSPLQLLDSSIKDRVGNDAILEFEDQEIEGMKVDGTNNFADNPNRKFRHKGQVGPESINNFISNLKFDTVFSQVRIESVDLEDNTRANLTSSLNVGVYGKWLMKWSPYFHTEMMLGMKHIEFEEASNYNIEKLSNQYYTLRFSGIYYLLDKLRFSLRTGLEQRPYIHARGSRILIIDPVSVFRIDSLLDWNFWEFDALNFGAIAGYTYLGGKTTDNFHLEDGRGYMWDLYVNKMFKSSYLQFKVGAEYADQNSSITNQKTREIGFTFQYVMPLGNSPLLY